MKNPYAARYWNLTDKGREMLMELKKLKGESIDFYFDYRFFVKAKDENEASQKIIDYLPESSEDIWYTIDKMGVFPHSLRKTARNENG